MPNYYIFPLHVHHDVPTAKSWFLLIQASISDHPTSQAGDMWDDDCSVSESESPSVADPNYSNGGVRKFNNPHYFDIDSVSNSEDPYCQLGDNTEDNSLSDATSSLSIGKKFVRSNLSQNQGETSEDPDDYCKEVQCIEMEESRNSKNPEFRTVRPGENEQTLALRSSRDGDVTGQGMMLTPVNRNGEVSKIQNGLPYGALEQKFHNVQISIDSLNSSNPSGTSLQVMEAGMMSSGSLKLTRSWSCRANFMAGSSSPEKTERIEHTPLNGFEKEFPGRPEGLQRKFPLLTYGSNATSLSRNNSQSSIGSASMDDLRSQSIRTSADGEITSIQTFVTGLKEMAKLDYEKQLVDGQVRTCLFAYFLA